MLKRRRQLPKTPKSKISLKRRLFIDPASKSTGWALFDHTKLTRHGTIAVDNRQVSFLEFLGIIPTKSLIFKRLELLMQEYERLSDSLFPYPEEVHIEQLVRNTHIYTHWSVGVIGAALDTRACTVAADIPIQSWQKHCDWKGERERLAPYKDKVESEDELAAIGMGLWYVNTKV